MTERGARGMSSEAGNKPRHRAEAHFSRILTRQRVSDVSHCVLPLTYVVLELPLAVHPSVPLEEGSGREVICPGRLPKLRTSIPRKQGKSRPFPADLRCFVGDVGGRELQPPFPRDEYIH